MEELVRAPAKPVPGLTPTQKQVYAESGLMQSEKDGVEVDQGIFLAQVLARPEVGTHLCHVILRPWSEALERCAEFVRAGMIDFGLARVERRGKAPPLTLNNPRFLNSEDDDTLTDVETAADIGLSIQ